MAIAIRISLFCRLWQTYRYNIHKTTNEFQRNGDYQSAEQVYRDALLIYPNKPGMILGLAGVLALQNKAEEAIDLMEIGLPLSINEKQKSTTRVALCFLYLKWEEQKKREHQENFA